MNDIVELHLCDINLRIMKEDEGTDVDSQVLIPIYHYNKTMEHVYCISLIGDRSSIP